MAFMGSGACMALTGAGTAALQRSSFFSGKYFLIFLNMEYLPHRLLIRNGDPRIICAVLAHGGLFRCSVNAWASALFTVMHKLLEFLPLQG
jgi:hypothetical protein